MTGAVRISRRAFVAGLGATALLPVAHAAKAHAAPGRRVAIFGGGMSGLVAAHELIERGFEVDVYEARNVMGGKARSFGVPGSSRGGRPELPAEHGFRFFPGFYRNVPDSMRRVPFPGNPNGVLDNLQEFSRLANSDGFGGASSSGPGRSIAGFLPLDLRARRPVDLGRLADRDYLDNVVSGALGQLMGVPAGQFPGEMVDFTRRVLIYLTSCRERREIQWDAVSWWDFLGAGHKSRFFQDSVAKMTTMGLVAVKPTICSVNSAGNIVEAFLWNLLLPRPGPGDAFVARMLNGPTSDVWITPWVQELTRLGVRFHSGCAVESFETAGGRITGARCRSADGSLASRVEADWYVAAIPVDIATRVLRTPNLLGLDPALDGIKDLQTDWMNGLMIYLRKPLEVAKGLFAIIDHPWTLSAVSQAQMWEHALTGRYGDGTVGDIVSVDISNWDEPGITVVRKPAKQCTRAEIFTEVWETLKQRFGPLDRALSEDNLHSWFLDPAITWDAAGRAHNAEPLTVQTVHTWARRPKGPTAIPNLFVAGDWIQTNANVISMEGANQGGRIAAQAVLDASGRNAERVLNYDYYVPPQMDGLKALDAQRYATGQPNLFM